MTFYPSPKLNAYRTLLAAIVEHWDEIEGLGRANIKRPHDKDNFVETLNRQERHLTVAGINVGYRAPELVWSVPLVIHFHTEDFAIWFRLKYS